MKKVKPKTAKPAKAKETEGEAQISSMQCFLAGFFTYFTDDVSKLSYDYKTGVHVIFKNGKTHTFPIKEIK